MEGLPLKRPTRGSGAHLLGEFVLIVVGVLTAFAVDDWATDRAERSEEVRYLRALVADVRSDSATLVNRFIPELTSAGEILGRIGPIVRGDAAVPPDTLALLRDIASTHFIPIRLGTQTTFEELLATASLRLIRSAELRSAVIAYYQFKDLAYARAESRASGYGELVRAVLPEQVGRRPTPSDADELIRAFGVRRAVTLIRTPDFAWAMNRHLNYIDTMRPTLDQLLSLALRLIASLDAELRAA